MKTYKIVSTDGVELGTYDAETREGALDAMARDAGYRDANDAAEVVGSFAGRVVEVQR